MTPMPGLPTLAPLTAGSHAAGGAPFMFPLFGFAVLVLLVGVVSYASVKMGRRSVHKESEGTDPALELLRRRYASGEIDEEEYRERRTELQG